MIRRLLAPLRMVSALLRPLTRLGRLLAPLARLAYYPRLVVALGVVLLVALVWLAGPYVGLSGSEARLLAMVVILAVAVLGLLLDRYRAQRNATRFEQALRQQAREQAAVVRPDRQEEIEQLRKQFEEAISMLKRSRLARGLRGSAALYALPWYMFIGPPASGKSTALRHSGLQFPTLGEGGKGVKGVGGTRNCDWWFTTEAVLLDTAGRYVTEEEDREEWYGFLDLLRRYRKAKPINGVLAAISIADLYECSDEELEEHARTIRARIDELIQRLGVVFPVYLVFTKCDLIRGFVEFFEDLNREEREQVWGAVFPRHLPPEATVRSLFEKEYNALLEVLYQRRDQRLRSARGIRKIREIYGFPLQLASGRDRLARFVEILFQKNPYQENPIFRGFFFTSGTQEGRPIDRILGRISRAAGFSAQISEVFETVQEPKSYFIKDLFTQIIFPDQILATPTSAMVRRRGALRVATLVGAVAAVALALTGLTLSYLGNQRLLGAVQDAVAEAYRLDPRDETRFPEQVQALERVRAVLARLETDVREGPPLRLRGLYRGGSLVPPLREFYLHRFHVVFLEPTRGALEVELEGFVGGSQAFSEERDSDYYYSLLKLYLMLGNPTHRDPAFLTQWLQNIWEALLVAYYGEGRIPEGLEEAVQRQIRFYSQIQVPEPLPTFPVNTQLVEEVRAVLRAVPLSDRLYARLRRTAQENLEPYTLETALGRSNLDPLMDDHVIPGLYTETGWRTAFQPTLEAVLEASGQEGWVLGVRDVPREELEQAIQDRYFQDYIRHWKRFLEGLRVRPPASLAEADHLLATLAGEDSPLRQVLEATVENTQFWTATPEEAVSGIARSLVQRVRRGLGMGKGTQSPDEGDTPPPTSHPVAAHFASLTPFVLPQGQTPPLLEAYQGTLEGIRGEVQNILQAGPGGEEARQAARGLIQGGRSSLLEARRTIDGLLRGLSPDLRQALNPLFHQPVQWVAQRILAQALVDLDPLWRAEVYDACRRGIEGRYPFQKAREEATLEDVAEFFHPREGVLWRFYEEELRPFIVEGRRQWSLRRRGNLALPLSREALSHLRRAREIAESLFPRGSAMPRFSFDLYPYPRAGVSEILFQVDGKGFRYRNEPQEWHTLAWPGGGGAPGALLQIRTTTRQARRFEGPWGLFRLLDTAKITRISATRYRVEWAFRVQGRRPLTIRYDLRAHRSKNPLNVDFRGFRCLPELG